MASDQPVIFTFNWGDTVKVKPTAPLYYKPRFQGCICGMRMIDSLDLARRFDQMVNTELYLIEFENGETIEIPKYFLINISTSD